MAFEQITVARSGAVGTVTMHRPDALNAITPTMLAELNTAIGELEADPECTICILTGDGRAFSAGVDLKALGDRELVGGSVGDILDLPARELTDRHAKFGLRPTWGMSQRLPAAVGITKARELSYTARNLKGVEAAQIGLACRSVPLAELDAVVDELAATIAANSAQSLVAYNDLYQVAEQRGVADGLVYEAATAYEITDTDERLAGFR